MIGKFIVITSALMLLTIGVLIWFIPEVFILGKAIITITTLWGFQGMLRILFDPTTSWT